MSVYGSNGLCKFCGQPSPSPNGPAQDADVCNESGPCSKYPNCPCPIGPAQEGLGYCCYGGRTMKAQCASCAAWTQINPCAMVENVPAPAQEGKDQSAVQGQSLSGKAAPGRQALAADPTTDELVREANDALSNLTLTRTAVIRGIIERLRDRVVEQDQALQTILDYRCADDQMQFVHGIARKGLAAHPRRAARAEGKQ